MDSARATGLFAASFVMRGLIDSIGAVESQRELLIGLVLGTSIATVAFWLGTRRASYRWFHAVGSAIAAFAAISFLFRVLPDLSRWTWLLVVFSTLALVSYLLAWSLGTLDPSQSAEPS